MLSIFSQQRYQEIPPFTLSCTHRLIKSGPRAPFQNSPASFHLLDQEQDEKMYRKR